MVGPIVGQLLNLRGGNKGTNGAFHRPSGMPLALLSHHCWWVVGKNVGGSQKKAQFAEKQTESRAAAHQSKQ